MEELRGYVEMILNMSIEGVKKAMIFHREIAELVKRKDVLMLIAKSNHIGAKFDSFDELYDWYIENKSKYHRIYSEGGKLIHEHINRSNNEPELRCEGIGGLVYIHKWDKPVIRIGGDDRNYQYDDTRGRYIRMNEEENVIMTVDRLRKIFGRKI